jgi:phage terminase small subunit
MPKSRLNLKQRRFRDEYLKDCNATQAAIRAGYSKKCAYTQGSRLLRNAQISEQIEKRLMESASSAGRILREARCILEANPKGLFDPDGKLWPWKDMPDEIAAAISGIDILPDGTHKVRFWSKTEAIALMGKYRKLFIERTELTGKDGKDIFDLEAWRKAVVESQ